MHLVAIALLFGFAFIKPALFWQAAIGYFALASILAVLKLQTMQLPHRCKKLQIWSVASVFAGIASAGLVSWFAQ